MSKCNFPCGLEQCADICYCYGCTVGNTDDCEFCRATQDVFTPVIPVVCHQCKIEMSPGTEWTDDLGRPICESCWLEELYKLLQIHDKEEK